MSGYSGTPLAKKLGLRSGARLRLVHAPPHYGELLGVDGGVDQGFVNNLDLIQHFVTRRSELAAALPAHRRAIKANGAIWISWPKRAAKLPTDVTEDVVRELALPLGLVDVKVCAIDATWSALKLVIRKELRGRTSRLWKKALHRAEYQ